MKRRYMVELSGCDDHTKLDLELTTEQARQLRALSALTRRVSEYGCQPTISIRGYDEVFKEES